MKPHPRIRKTVKWGGAVVSVILLVVWVGSGWRAVCWGDPHGHRVVVAGGTLRIGRVYPGLHGIPWQNNGLTTHSHAWSFRVQSPLGWIGPRARDVDWMFSCAIWFPAAIAMLMALFVWRNERVSARRAMIGVCPKCSYSRTGLAPTAVCPECGTPALVPPPSAS